MDTAIYARRKARLHKLLADRFQGRQVDLAIKVERDANYISRCLSGRKNIGEGFARLIEKVCFLPEGWLDSEESQPPTSKHGVPSDLVEAWRYLLPEEQEAFARQIVAAASTHRRTIAIFNERMGKAKMRQLSPDNTAGEELPIAPAGDSDMAPQKRRARAKPKHA